MVGENNAACIVLCAADGLQQRQGGKNYYSRRWGIDQSLSFGRIYNGFLGQRKAQVGSYSSYTWMVTHQMCLTNLPDDGDDHYQVIFWNMENIVSIRRYEFVRVASVEILEQRANGIQQTPAMDSRRKWRRRRKLKL